jgi:hypothetical protein
MPSRHVDRDPVEVLAAQRRPLAPAATPAAQVRALVRENVLEKSLAGEELEIRVMDPALALTLIGQPANVLSNNTRS